MTDVPYYRGPRGALVPAKVAAIAFADFTLAGASDPLPVFTDTPDPNSVTNTPPKYDDPRGIDVISDVTAIILSDGTIVGPGNPLPVSGGGGGGDAYTVAYTTPSDPTIENVGEALDLIFYVDTEITSFTGGSTVEIGSSVASVTLNWSINKEVTSQSISNGVGSLDPSLRTLFISGPFTTNQTWQLTASDGQTADNASTSLLFRNKRYWGVSPNTSLNDAQIQALSQEFATNNNKSVVYDATGGNYPYFCYPTSFGPLTSVTVGGLPFSDYTASVQSFTNASGHTEDYYVVRFNNIQTGAAISVVWS